MSVSPLEEADARLWAPLYNERFRSLWIANGISNLGTWMQGMGAAWLMVQLSSSSQMVALIQTAMTLPIFLLVVPAGILADRFDRRSYLLATHVAMAIAAFGLSIIIALEAVTPSLLLLGTFLLGCGAAMTMPAWQAATSSLVEPTEIHSAAALNGMSFNFARTLGPALAGLIAQISAIALIFWMNAASYLALIFVFWRWRSTSANAITGPKAPRKSRSFGFGHILQHERFIALLVRTFLIFFGASSMWSLLPAFAGLELHMNASSVGLLMGTIGAGAIVGGMLLPSLKARVGIDRLTRIAAALLGFALFLAACNVNYFALWLAMVLTGMGWAFIVSGLNGTAQSTFPVQIRGKAISVYLMAMYGGTTSGSWTWGLISTSYGVPYTFVAAATMLLICAWALKRLSIA